MVKINKHTISICSNSKNKCKIGSHCCILSIEVVLDGQFKHLTLGA